jgi:hypothetical protein
MQWLEFEDKFLNPEIRNDLRHLLTHGACRYMETLKLYKAFKNDNGKPPDNVYEMAKWLKQVEGEKILQRLAPQKRALLCVDCNNGRYQTDTSCYAKCSSCGIMRASYGEG